MISSSKFISETFETSLLKFDCWERSESSWHLTFVIFRANLSTYKELCSLASDLNQPDLIYKFMQLANHHSQWNSKKVYIFIALLFCKYYFELRCLSQLANFLSCWCIISGCCIRISEHCRSCSWTTHSSSSTDGSSFISIHIWSLSSNQILDDFYMERYCYVTAKNCKSESFWLLSESYW